jgi:hypothetical protein
VPLKIRIFIWQVVQNKIQTGQQLKARNWKGRGLCRLCREKEDANHLLFSCPLAEFVWACVSEALGCDGYPRSITELISVWLPNKFGVSFQTALSCFAGLAWAIWMTRNSMCMRNVFPANPTDVIHLGLSFVQKWKVLMKELQRRKVEALATTMLQFLKSFKPLNSHPSDVAFI